MAAPPGEKGRKRERGLGTLSVVKTDRGIQRETEGDKKETEEREEREEREGERGREEWLLTCEATAHGTPARARASARKNIRRHLKQSGA